MLKVEVIKFEAQDVITASGVASSGVTKVPSSCGGDDSHNLTFTNVNGTWQMVCTKCGYTGSTTGGTVEMEKP